MARDGDRMVSEVEYEWRAGDAISLVVDVQAPDSVGVPTVIGALENIAGVRNMHVRMP